MMISFYNKSNKLYFLNQQIQKNQIMKETFNYPKTLRSYDDENQKIKYSTSPHSNSKNHKSPVRSISKYKRVAEQQTHNIDEYCILTNPSQLKSKKNNSKKYKNKNNKDESRLSAALKQQLHRPLVSHSQIGPNNIVHCKSLQRLQIISNDRSEQIKTLITEKALLIAQNEELKAKLINPTYRQQQYIQKVVQKEYEVQNLKQSLKRKEQKIIQIQKQFKKEIDNLKLKHRQQMSNLRDQINKLKMAKSNHQTQKGVNYTTFTTNKMAKQEIPYSTVNATQTRVYNKSNQAYTIGQSANQKKYNNNSQRPIHSVNYSNYFKDSTHQKKISPEKQASPPKIVTQDNKNYRTYVGEDGYERRVYYKEGQQNKSAINNDNSNINTNSNKYFQSNSQVIRYQNSISPFTNQKITNNLTQSKQVTSTQAQSKYSNLYRYGGSEAYNASSSNMYSNSLTFQCLNDKN